jgi:hypothetical protein
MTDDKEQEQKSNPVVQCPHCQEFVEILQINCAIFRHAICKETGQQINPHSSKELCDQYIKDNKIYGCGKPFKVFFKEEILVAEVCEYI